MLVKNNKHRVVLAGVGLLSVMVVTQVHAANLSAGLGIEHFNWQEKSQHGRELVEESGPRLTLSLRLSQTVGQHKKSVTCLSSQRLLGQCRL